MALILEKPLSAGFQKAFYRAWLDACTNMEASSRSYQLSQEALKQSDCSGLVLWVLNRLGLPVPRRYTAELLARYVFNRFAVLDFDCAVKLNLEFANTNFSLSEQENFPIPRTPNGEWRTSSNPETHKFGVIAENIAAWFWYDESYSAGNRISHVALQFGPSMIIEINPLGFAKWPQATAITPAGVNKMNDHLNFVTNLEDDGGRLGRRAAMKDAYAVLHNAIESNFLVYYKKGSAVVKEDFTNVVANLQLLRLSPEDIGNNGPATAEYKESPDIYDSSVTDLTLSESPYDCPKFIEGLRTCHFTIKGLAKLHAIFNGGAAIPRDITSLTVNESDEVVTNLYGRYYGRIDRSGVDPVMVESPYVNIQTGAALTPYNGGVPLWLHYAYLDVFKGSADTATKPGILDVLDWFIKITKATIDALIGGAQLGINALVHTIVDRYVNLYLDEIETIPGARTRAISELNLLGRIEDGSPRLDNGWFKGYLNFEVLESLSATGFHILYDANDSTSTLITQTLASQEAVERQTVSAPKAFIPAGVTGGQYGIPVRF